MAQWPALIRDVIHDVEFDQQGALLMGSIERLDEVLAGVSIVVARHPDIYPSFGRLSVVRTTATPLVPELWILYTYTDRLVTFHAIQVAP